MALKVVIGGEAPKPTHVPRGTSIPARPQPNKPGRVISRGAARPRHPRLK